MITFRPGKREAENTAMPGRSSLEFANNIPPTIAHDMVDIAPNLPFAPPGLCLNTEALFAASTDHSCSNTYYSPDQAWITSEALMPNDSSTPTSLHSTALSLSSCATSCGPFPQPNFNEMLSNQAALFQQNAALFAANHALQAELCQLQTRGEEDRQKWVKTNSDLVQEICTMRFRDQECLALLDKYRSAQEQLSGMDQLRQERDRLSAILGEQGSGMCSQAQSDTGESMQKEARIQEFEANLASLHVSMDAQTKQYTAEKTASNYRIRELRDEVERLRKRNRILRKASENARSDFKSLQRQISMHPLDHAKTASEREIRSMGREILRLVDENAVLINRQRELDDREARTRSECINLRHRLHTFENACWDRGSQCQSWQLRPTALPSGITGQSETIWTPQQKLVEGSMISQDGSQLSSDLRNSMSLSQPVWEEAGGQDYYH